MPDSIANSTPEAVINAIEDNLIEASVILGRTQNGMVFRAPDVTWVYTGYPALSRVLRARFTEEQAEDRVGEITECFRRWNAPVSWIIGPTTWPPQITGFLTDTGFKADETWHGTAVELKTITSEKKSPLRIELVTEKNQFEQWVGVNDEPWEGQPGDAVQIFSPENSESASHCRYYLGWINDQPVCRAMLCMKGTTAGLHWVSSKSPATDEVYEIALATRALIDARTGGAKLGAMPVRSATDAIAKKLGFKTYCQFKTYHWPPAPAKSAVC